MVELSIIRELSYVRVPQLGKITQCTASLSSTNMRKRLCECIDFSHVHTECGTNISNGMSHAIGLHHRDACDPVITESIANEVVDLQSSG